MRWNAAKVTHDQALRLPFCPSLMHRDDPAWPPWIDWALRSGGVGICFQLSTGPNSWALSLKKEALFSSGARKVLRK